MLTEKKWMIDMSKIVENENIACFDVDDTIILHPKPNIDKNQLNIEGYKYFTHVHDGKSFLAKPSEIHIKLLKDYRARGFYNIVWSGNGYAHAANILSQLGLMDYVDKIMTKPGRYVDDQNCEDWMGVHIYLEDKNREI